MKKITTYLLGFLMIGILVAQPTIAQDRNVQLAEQLKIFPNPTDGKFQLTLKYEGNEKVTAKVYDITGKVIEDISNELVKEESSVTAHVELKDPRTGIYFLRIQMGSKLLTKKIIVK
jgi:hypothetical protein